MSAGTLGLLEQAHRAASRRSGAAEVTELLGQIAAFREPRAILYLRELLLDRRGSVREAASAAIGTLLREVELPDMIWFDEQMRQGWLAAASLRWPRWHSLTPFAMALRLPPIRNDRCALILGIMHASGFVREACLRRAAKIGLADALPLVVIRLRDWVPEVRAAATAAWRALSRTAPLADLAPLLSVFLRLRGLARAADLDAAYAELGARLSERGSEGLLIGRRLGDPVVRRHCFGALLAVGAPPARLARDALEDPDPLVQRWALTEALHRTDGADWWPVLADATRIAGARVQTHALQLMWNRDRERSRPHLEHALLASATSLREFAVWALRQSSSVDIAEYYRTHIDGGLPRRQLAAAVLELGRLGGPDDVARVTGLLRSETAPTVHAAALRALARLAPDEARPHYLIALRAPSRRVAGAARDLLLADRDVLLCGELASIGRGAEFEHSRLYALTVVQRRCLKWFRLALLLELVIDRVEPYAAIARRGIGEWLINANRNWIAPQAAEVARLARLIERCEGELPAPLRERLRFFLS